MGQQRELLSVSSFDFPVDPSNTALLVIDLQKGYAHPEYGFAKAIAAVGTNAEQESSKKFHERLRTLVIPNVQRLLKFFRARQLRVIFITMGTNTEDLVDLTPTLRARHLERHKRSGHLCIARKGSTEYEILDEIRPRTDELVVSKISQSAFTSSNLDYVLRNMGMRSLVVTGIMTSGCVLATAISAANRGYGTILVEDALGAIDFLSHEAALRVFQNDFGKVFETQTVISKLQGQGAELE